MSTNQSILTRVAGVTFEGRQELIKQLNLPDPIQIVPEPENPYDPNALAVHVAHDGQVWHIGYIPKEIAHLIAPLIDGEKVIGSIHEINGGFTKTDGEQASLGIIIKIEVPHA